MNAIKLQLWATFARKENAIVASTRSLADNIGAIKGCLSSDCRRQFLQSCWDFQTTDFEWAKIEGKFDSYFSSYEEFCQVERPDALTTCSHEDLCRSTRTLTIGTREQVERSLSTHLATSLNDNRDNKSVVEFIGKAILRIDLTSWRNGEVLEDYISRIVGTVSAQTDRDRLPPTFNAATLRRKAGIRILWQQDLTSHLLIDFGDTTLKLFHDVALLDLLESSPFKDIFPPSFIQETCRIIDLMIPTSEPMCRRWLKQESQTTRLGVSVEDHAYRGVVDRNLQTFNFWRDRLIVAKDVFDTSQPKGLKQFLLDDRNKVQYWTFWIAFVVFWLTLGGFVTSCLQAYKAYHPSPQPPWPGPQT